MYHLKWVHSCWLEVLTQIQLNQFSQLLEFQNPQIFFLFFFFYYFCLLLALLYLTLIHYRFEMTVECFNLTFIYSSQEFTCIFVKVITKERQEHCVRTEKSKSMQMEPGRLHFHFVVCVPISKLWGHYRLQVFFREAMQ